MKNYYYALMLAFLALLSACSSPQDNAADAELIAQSWVDSNMEAVADAAAQAITKDYSAVAKAAIKLTIKEGLTYSYRAEKLKQDRWRVYVTASQSVDLSKIGLPKRAEVRGTIRLEVDTDKRRILGTEIESKNFSANLTNLPSSQSLAPSGANASAGTSTPQDRRDYPKNISELLRVSHLSFDEELQANELSEDLSFFAPCKISDDRFAFVCNHFPFVVSVFSARKIVDGAGFFAEKITVLLPCSDKVPTECQGLLAAVSRIPSIKQRLKASDITTIQGYADKRFVLVEWAKN